MTHELRLVRPDPDFTTTWRELLGIVEHDTDWMRDGLCAQADPDAWFPEKGETNTDAKQVCARCPVIEQCLEYALTNHERFGVWGGTSADERRVLLGHRPRNRNGGFRDVA